MYGIRRRRADAQKIIRIRRRMQSAALFFSTEGCGELSGLYSLPRAIHSIRRVLLLQPDRATTHNSLGWALQEEGRLTEAMEHYRTAQRLDPDLDGAKLNIGGVHEELGELSEAESAFRAAVAIQPRFVLAHVRLATLLRGKLPHADRAALEERLADTNVSGEPRRDCGGICRYGCTTTESSPTFSR